VPIASASTLIDDNGRLLVEIADQRRDPRRTIFSPRAARAGTEHVDTAAYGPGDGLLLDAESNAAQRRKDEHRKDKGQIRTSALRCAPSPTFSEILPSTAAIPLGVAR
jgi:hypothetical protein